MSTATMAGAARQPITKKQRRDLLMAQLKNERSSFEPDWQDCAKHLAPRRYRKDTSDRNKGGRGTAAILNSAGTFAARTLASGLMSGVSSPARPWFRLTTDPTLLERRDVKAWLADVTKTLQQIIARSNTYNVFANAYVDLGLFGIAALSVEEDGDDIIRCKHYPVGTYYVATNAKGEVRTFARELQMTAENIVARWAMQPDGSVDWSRVSQHVRDLVERGHGLQWVTVYHLVTENSAYDPTKLLSKYKRVYQCYWEAAPAAGDQKQDGAVVLEESGFDEFPVLVPRWDAMGEDAYPTEWPASVALGDVRQLQKGERMLAKAIDKLIDPPLVADGGMKGERISQLPGDITFGRSMGGQTDTVRPLHEVKPETLTLREVQAQVEYRIQRAFYADLFLMLQNLDAQPMTAREIEERHEEKLLALGPVLERLNADLFDPFIDRVFNICLRRGLFPEPPEALQGADIPVEYISIMAQAQKMVALSGFDHFVSRAGQLAALKPNDPGALDKLDLDQSLDELADMTGMPPRAVLDDDRVAALRQARAEAAQAAEQSRMLAEQAQAARNLSQADTTGPNALTELLNANGGPVAAGAGLGGL